MYEFKLSALFNLVNSNYFLLIVDLLSFIFKSIIFSKLVWELYFQKKKNIPIFFLISLLFAAAMIDFGWICALCNRINWYLFSPQTVSFIDRIGWAFFVLQYHSMIELLEALITKEYKCGLRKNSIFLIISLLFVVFFSIFPFIAWNTYGKAVRAPIEYIMKHLCSIYLLLCLMPFNLWRIYKKLKNKHLPVIVRKQCTLLFWGLVIPYLLSDLVNMNPIRASYFGPLVKSQAFTGISTLLLTYLLYFCMKRILNIRFVSNEMPMGPKLFHEGFSDQYLLLVSALEKVKFEHEIIALVRPFIAQILYVAPEKVSFFIRHHLLQEPEEGKTYEHTPLMYSIELQLEEYGVNFLAHLYKHRFVFLDDTDFLYFYEPTQERKQALLLLESIQGIVFVPIFARCDLIGYIVVQETEGVERLYNGVDRDRLIMCTNHLAAVIAHMQMQQKLSLYEKNRALLDELACAKQQILYLRESMQILFRPYQMKQIGIFYYKHREFAPVNKEAEELIAVDLNVEMGHQTVQRCMNLMKQVQENRSKESVFVTGKEGKRLLAVGFPHLDQKQFVMVVTTPDMNDMVSNHLAQLKSMDDWDSLLSLQMTKVGDQFNALLPGWSKGIVQLKVAMLKKIIQYRALCIECDPDDSELIAHLVHTVAGRKHPFAIVDPFVNPDYAYTLFGKAWPYGMGQPDHPLLKSLNGGTLCIVNSQALNADVQRQLVQYVQEGQFKRVGGTAVCHSDVYLLFMTPYTVQETPEYIREFRSLFADRIIVIPSPSRLEESDLMELIEGYSIQAVCAEIRTPLFTLSEYEKRKIIGHHSASLTELKKRVFNALRQKHKPSTAEAQVIFDPAFLLVDQTLAHAARLGKNALKERKTMAFLWIAFEKNQNKIAQFLGVERSSVHRRVKEYRLT